jgi:hypothetical protein
MIGKKINQLATELAPESTDLTIIGDPTTGVSKKITIAQLGAIFSGAVSFYTNLAAFPVTGDINVIYCAKDTQKLYLWTGSAYVEVFPSQALLDTYQLRSEKGNANGYASLDSLGKVPISQLPSSLMEYKGTWNAATNTPTLANGTGDTGDVYICNVAGTVNFGAGPITFAVGDYVIYSGTIWQRSSGAVGTVTSVAASITGDSVTISGSPVTTSGTLAFAFAGTGAQYIKGDGTLATFPNTIDQAKNLITEVYNSTGSTLTKGTVVYINGGQGNLPTVTKALATGDSTSAQTYGIVQADITNNNNGFVVVAGRLADIDTQAFSVGTQLYLSSTTAGAYTSTKQYAPAHLVYIGIIVRSHPTQGIIEVKIQNGYELDELHNVAAQTPTNNDGLFWETSTSLWKNKSIATVLGYTPANPANFVPYTGATGNVNLGTNDLLSRSVFIEGDTNYQAGLLMKQYSVYNFVTGAYTQIAPSTATELNIVHNQANTTRRRYSLSVAALQDGDSFQYLVPRASGTIALTSDLTGGTVTSVAALTIGTSGTDLSSTVANGTTTPVITLNVPTASATNRGALSSTDWTTFNNKQNALTNPITGISASGRVAYFNGDTSITGSSNFFWDSTNNRLGIGLNNPQRTLEIHNATADSQLRISGAAPSVSLGEAITGAIYQAKFGLITANGQYVTGGVAGDFVMISQTGATIFATSSTEKMRVQASGNVSIGNTNDTYKLDVSGTGRFTSNLYTSTALYIGTTAAYGFKINSEGNSGFYNRGGSTSSHYPFLLENSSGSLLFQVQGNGAATFSSSLTIGNTFNINASAWLQFSGNNVLLADSGDTFLQASGTGSIIFRNNAAARIMTMTNGGNVGIGTTSPQTLFTVSGANQALGGAFNTYGNVLITSNEGPAINRGGSFSLGGRYWTGNTTIATFGRIHGKKEDASDGSTAGYLSFETTREDGALLFERMRITSTGNVGLGGITNPQTQLQLNGTITFSEAGFNTVRLNQIASQHSDGSSPNNFIRFLVSNGSGVTSERMRIDGDGKVLMGTTTYGGVGNSFDNGGGIIVNYSGTGSRVAVEFKNNNGTIGTITCNGSATAYNTSSDYRLKQDLKDFNGLDLVSKLKAYDYEWKSDNTRSYGVIAHELQSVINYAVTGEKDGKEMQGVDYSKIVPVLIKAIQELNDKIK